MMNMNSPMVTTNTVTNPPSAVRANGSVFQMTSYICACPGYVEGFGVLLGRVTRIFVRFDPICIAQRQLSF
jgi:hypothetical protein